MNFIQKNHFSVQIFIKFHLYIREKMMLIGQSQASLGLKPPRVSPPTYFTAPQ